MLRCALCCPIRRGNVAPAHAISSLNPVEEPPRELIQPYQSYSQAATGFSLPLLEIGTLVIIENPMASPELPSLMSAHGAQSTSGFSPNAAKSGTHPPFESLGP